MCLSSLLCGEGRRRVKGARPLAWPAFELLAPSGQHARERERQAECEGLGRHSPLTFRLELGWVGAKMWFRALALTLTLLARAGRTRITFTGCRQDLFYQLDDPSAW